MLLQTYKIDYQYKQRYILKCKLIIYTVNNIIYTCRTILVIPGMLLIL